MTKVSLYWPDYRLLPYERDLAIDEMSALLRPRVFETAETAIRVDTTRLARLRALTYFKAYQRGSNLEPTTQAVVERNGTPASEPIRRQSTRYSAHGLHEYKGKFNPQIARAILNTADLRGGAVVLDPFCGSGTTLVEAVHLGFTPVGADLNPLATFIATAKIDALAMHEADFAELANLRLGRPTAPDKSARGEYLQRWFASDTLAIIERMRASLLKLPESQRRVGLTIASNLLREFSLQEPADLRIRRRISPPSTRDLLSAFHSDTRGMAEKIAKVRATLGGAGAPSAHVLNIDSTRLMDDPTLQTVRGKINLAITSPPYAMALPYIDTQRLSLIWLDLVAPARLSELQADLIGSREFKGGASAWLDMLNENSAALPPDAWRFCRKLARSVGEEDGFRRRAVPTLMYRYLSGMRKTFAAVGDMLAPGARFYLVVGHNHTTLSGKRIDVDTPTLLTKLLDDTCLEVDGRKELQTYQRYGLHQRNAVNREELLILRKR